MKIEFVVTGLDRGGAEIQVRDLALQLAARGHQIGVTSLMPPRAFKEELLAGGVHVKSLNLDYGRKGPVRVAQAVVDLRRYLQSRQPCIVHSHMVHANLLTRIALTILPRPKLICTAHSTNEGGMLRDIAYRCTNWVSDLNTTVSMAATKRFVQSRTFPPSTVTMYNGVSMDAFPFEPRASSATGAFRWVAVGRLEPAKDYPNLLNAMTLLDERHSLDIIGEGALRRELAAIIANLGLSNRVRLLGATTDVAAAMKTYDGFVLSSAWEGFGLVVVEAMATGLPVVATACGGPEEIVGLSGEAGILVPPRTPTSLAHGMRTILDMPPDARMRMTCNARRRVEEEFSLDAQVSRWEELYRSLRNKGRGKVEGGA